MINLEEWLIQDLIALPGDIERLETIKNPLEYRFLKRSIKDRETLLEQLGDNERFIVETTVIKNIKITAVAKESGLTMSEIYAIRRRAIDELLLLRHGAGYKP